MNETLEQPKTAKKKNSKSGLLDPLYIDLAGLATGTASGFIAAFTSINNKFFSNTEKDELLKAEHLERTNAYTELNNRKPFVIGEAYFKERNAITEKYAKDITTKLEERGIKGYLDKWRTLAKHQKTEVMLSTAAVTAITLGAFINLAGSWRVGRKENELEQRLNDLENKQQR